MSQATQPQRVDLRPAQQTSLDILKHNFALSDADLNRCIFFKPADDEPWIPSDLLEVIARRVGKFQLISVTYSSFIEKLQQVIYESTVIDEQGRSFVRSGVAAIGERPFGMEIDTNVLATGRALSAALTAAGFNPFRSGTVAEIDRSKHFTPAEQRERAHLSGPLTESQRGILREADEAAARGKDLRQIHAIAERQGLIIGNDSRPYRNWLQENYGTITAASLDRHQRQSVINALDRLQDDLLLADVPDEFRQEALIA